jgi:hypothetical protein
MNTAKYADHSPDDRPILAAIETFGCFGVRLIGYSVCALSVQQPSGSATRVRSERRLVVCCDSIASASQSACSVARPEPFIIDRRAQFRAH